MAKRPSWSGFLKLSLVTCPIQLYSATTHAETISFHFINPKTGNRVQMKPFDPDTGPLERKDLVRGYEIEDGKYVTVTDEDLKAIRLKSTKMIEIEKFVDFAAIDPLYLDGAYFVMPDGKAAVEAYAVIREAMRKEKKAAEGRLTLSFHEHVTIIQPRGKGLMLHRMRDAREVEAHAPFEAIEDVEVDPKMVDIAVEIIKQKQGRFQPAEFKDPYEEALIELLKRRARGAKPIHAAEETERPTNVVNLMDALRKSLGTSRRSAGARSDGEESVVPFRKTRAKSKTRAAAQARAKPGGRRRAGGR